MTVSYADRCQQNLSICYISWITVGNGSGKIRGFQIIPTVDSMCNIIPWISRFIDNMLYGCGKIDFRQLLTKFSSRTCTWYVEFLCTPIETKLHNPPLLRHRVPSALEANASTEVGHSTNRVWNIKMIQFTRFFRNATLTLQNWRHIFHALLSLLILVDGSPKLYLICILWWVPWPNDT